MTQHTHTVPTSDWFLAGGTEGASGGMVVDFAMWLSLVVKVVPSGERHPTHLHHTHNTHAQHRNLTSKDYSISGAVWVSNESSV